MNTSLFVDGWELQNKENNSAMRSVCVKMEVPVLVLSQKSSFLSSTSLQMDEPFWAAVSATLQPISYFTLIFS